MNARTATVTQAGPARYALLVKAFTLLRQRPGAADQARLQRQLQWIHEHNVKALGWLDAEMVRCCAFSDAFEQLPTGEARESDFAAFLAATRDDPYSETDRFGALDGTAGAHL